MEDGAQQASGKEQAAKVSEEEQAVCTGEAYREGTRGCFVASGV